MEIKVKFGILSLGIILIQSVLKLSGVIITGSLSFLSETVDTFIDILFVSITLYSLHQSEKPADLEHMYGHGKIDSISVLIQGIVLVSIYVFLIYNTIQIILLGKYLIRNPGLGLIILIISFAINIIFSRILIFQGKKQKSLTLEIQGLNLFQDSMRAFLVFFSFLLVYFDIDFIDPILSIILSVWIIIGAFKLAKKGIKELSDTNPISLITLEGIRKELFLLEHVIGVHELKTRVSGKTLFLEIHLSVEDHISVVHANEIIKSIRSMSDKIFLFYEVECIVEMNPMASEKSIGEGLINLILSMKSEFPEIINTKDLNIYSFENMYFISLVVIIDDNLSLEEAHQICTNFEIELKQQASYISRVITHIEGQPHKEKLSSNQIKCADVGTDMMDHIHQVVEGILKSHPQVKGYHGLKVWTALDKYNLEIHIFFHGALNISQIHNYITELERSFRQQLEIENLDSIFLHSEPIRAGKKGILF